MTLLLKLKLFIHQLRPFFILLLLDICDRLHVLGFLPVEPLLMIPMLFFWSIHRPENLSALTVCCVGLIDDCLSGALLGQEAAKLLFLYGISIFHGQRLRDMSFRVRWGAFFLCMLGATILDWFLVSVLHGQFLPPLDGLIQNLFTVLLYPWFNKAVSKFEEKS